MGEAGTKKKQFKFCKIGKNINSLPAQTPAWLPTRPRSKIENLPENNPRDFDCSLTDHNFITINSPTAGVDDIVLPPCVLDSVNCQTVPLREILILVCVPPQHQNQFTTVAHQSLTVLIQWRIEIRVKHQNPVPLLVDLLDL